MRLFGVTKLDKLRLLYEKKNVSYENRQRLDERINFYYPETQRFGKAGNVIYSFTPTKQIGNRGVNLEHNLQMPTQDVFLKTLKDITLNNSDIQSQSWFTGLHLAKDLLTKGLASRLYSRLEPEIIESQTGTTSLYLHYHHDVDSETNYKFLIKFYDKSAEYFKRHNTYICKLYEKPTSNDIEQLGTAYNRYNNSINLSKVNWLRVEIEFQESVKILPITTSLFKEVDRLTTSLVIQSLQKNTLYETLNKVFNRILQKHIFHAKETLKQATADVSAIRKLACELLLDSDLYHYKAVANELGVKDQFVELEKIVRKITPDSELYTELYNKLFPSSLDIAEMWKEGLFICSCNSYNSITLKHFLLVYEVPIFDDS